MIAHYLGLFGLPPPQKNFIFAFFGLELEITTLEAS
jgi:hypothetical protein